MILVTKTSDQTRQRGQTHSLYLYKSYLSPEHLVLPPLLPCCPGWQLLDQPFLFYIFFAFHPCLPRFPHGVYNYFAVSCAFLPPFRSPQSCVCVCQNAPRPSDQPPVRGKKYCVCVCVFSSYLIWTSSSLDVPAEVTQEERHTGFLIHLSSAVHAFIFLEKDSAVPFPRRP